MPFERLGTQKRCHILPLTGFHPPMSRGDSPDLLHFLCFRRTCVRPSVPRRGSLECHCASANCRSHEVWAADHLQRVRVSREDVSQNVIV